MESSDVAITEYNQLRASVGMAPASDDDCCEYVAWVVVFDLLAPEVADECKCLPVEQHALFMMTYATYLSWLAMKGVESKFPPDSWRLVAPLLRRELSKQPWHDQEVMDRLFDCMVKNPPLEKRKGRYFDASLGPWPDAVMATNMAGYKLNYSTNAEFILYVAIMSGKILETIGNIAPTDELSESVQGP